MTGDTAAAKPSARVLGRVDNWWYSKVAPALALSYVSAIVYRVPAWPVARSILLIAFVGLCAGSYGHIVNDVFDIEVDRNAGKRNNMAAFTPWQRFALCALTLTLGFAPALFVSYSATSLLLLAVEFLLPTIYSVPPVRLKGRGALGLLCDSLGAHLVPCLYVISVLAHQTSDPALLHTRSAVAFVWLTAIWALFLGLVGILVHEFEDRENDIRSGIRTFATGTELHKLRGPIAVFYAIELCAFAGLAAILLPIAPLIAIAALLFAGFVAIKLASNWQHYRRYDQDDMAIEWWQFSHAFYEGPLPMAAAIQCAWVHPALTAFPILQLVAFAPSFRKLAAEVRRVSRVAIPWLLWSGRLDLVSGAEAHASAMLFPLPGLRVEIARSQPELWNVRLARSGLNVHAGDQFRLRIMVRATHSRTIMFGIWQDHAPWHGIGSCEQMQITSRWQRVTRDIAITSADPHAYLGFWLGGEPGSVELSRCWLRRTPSVR